MDADSSRSQLLFRQEAAFNEALPVNPAMSALRFTKENFKHANATVVSNEIRADRMRSDSLLVGQSVNGGFSFELSGTTYDTFLAAFLSGAWVANVLKNGVVAPTSFQFERGLLDVGQYFAFRGCNPADLNLTFPSQEKVVGDMSFMGTLGAIASTSMLGTGVLTPVTTTQVMTSGPGINTINLNGSAIGVGVREIKLAVRNNLRARPVVDSLVTRAPGRGVLDITGSVTVYFATAALYAFFLAHSSFALAFRVSDGIPTTGKFFDFVLPKCKMPDDTVEVTGVDADIIETFQFRALYDATLGCEIQITRGTLP
jgi:hypothetical protein